MDTNKIKEAGQQAYKNAIAIYGNNEPKIAAYMFLQGIKFNSNGVIDNVKSLEDIKL